MSSDVAIKVAGLGKAYQIYDSPGKRLKQFFVPRLRRIMGLSPTAYYRDFWALRDLNFEIRQGDAVAIVGRNGSGKSTLLQIVAGTLSATCGEVEVRGRVAALLELGSGFNPEFTGRENVFLNGMLLGLSRQEIADRFEEIAAFAAIGDFIDQPVKTYSSGMVVRLAFSVSVCVEPEILIVDEALAVGDAGFQFKCMERLARLRASGTTLLFVSHDMGMVKSFCTSAIYLERGVEKLQGSPDQIVEQYFMDLRDEQRKNISDSPVIRKPVLGDNKRSGAFGTEEGSIVKAAFSNGLRKAVVKGGEALRFQTSIVYDRSLAGACLSVVLMERRMIDIGGKFFRLDDGVTEGERLRSEVEVEFEATLCPGEYFITLRLESRDASGWFFPVDKQVAALSFEVMPYSPDFLGISKFKFDRIS